MICDYIPSDDIPAAIIGGVPASAGLRRMPYRFTDAEAQAIIISRLRSGFLNDATYMINHGGHHIYNPETIVQVAQGGHTECIEFILDYLKQPDLAEEAFINLPHVITGPKWVPNLTDDLIIRAVQTRARHSGTYLIELAELVGITRFIEVIGKKDICSAPILAHRLPLCYNYAEKLEIFTRACADGLPILEYFYHPSSSNSGWIAAANNDRPEALELLKGLDRDNGVKHSRHFLLDLYYGACRLWKFSSAKWIAKYLDPDPDLKQTWKHVIDGRYQGAARLLAFIRFLESYRPLDSKDFQYIFGFMFRACSFSTDVMEYLSTTYLGVFDEHLIRYINSNTYLMKVLYERNDEIIKWYESRSKLDLNRDSDLSLSLDYFSQSRRFRSACEQGDFDTACMLYHYDLPINDSVYDMMGFGRLGYTAIRTVLATVSGHMIEHVPPRFYHSHILKILLRSKTPHPDRVRMMLENEVPQAPPLWPWGLQLLGSYNLDRLEWIDQALNHHQQSSDLDFVYWLVWRKTQLDPNRSLA